MTEKEYHELGLAQLRRDQEWNDQQYELSEELDRLNELADQFRKDWNLPRGVIPALLKFLQDAGLELPDVSKEWIRIHSR